MIRVANFMAATRSEGPGERFAVWVQGCSILCPGCCNQEMLPFSGGTLYSVEELTAKILASGNKGISLLGGEPFDQAEELGILAGEVQKHDIGVMVFSGYTLLRLKRNPKYHQLLSHTDLLKAGPYIQKRHSAKRRWIGSENQVLYYLTDRYKHHEDILENFTQSVTIDLRRGMACGWPEFFEV